MADRNSNFRIIEKPKKEEYPEYSEMYMNLLKDDGMVLQNMKDNFIKIKNFICEFSEEQLHYRYETGKWTIKEILVHIIDDERIFSYRALRYGRNDNTPLHGFEENDYAKYSYATDRSLDSIFDEYESVRNATLTLFQNLPDDAFMRSGGGIYDDGSIINIRTVRALAYHLAGHELKHIKVIKERYLNLSTEKGII